MLASSRGLRPGRGPWCAAILFGPIFLVVAGGTVGPCLLAARDAKTQSNRPDWEQDGLIHNPLLRKGYEKGLHKQRREVAMLDQRIDRCSDSNERARLEGERLVYSGEAARIQRIITMRFAAGLQTASR